MKVLISVNTLSNILLRIYLTTYIYRDILHMICIKKRKGYGYFTVSGVGMSGFPVILTGNHVSAPIRNVIALIGKNPVRPSKRKWSRATCYSNLDTLPEYSLELRGVEV